MISLITHPNCSPELLTRPMYFMQDAMFKNEIIHAEIVSNLTSDTIPDDNFVSIHFIWRDESKTVTFMLSSISTAFHIAFGFTDIVVFSEKRPLFVYDYKGDTSYWLWHQFKQHFIVDRHKLYNETRIENGHMDTISVECSECATKWTMVAVAPIKDEKGWRMSSAMMDRTSVKTGCNHLHVNANEFERDQYTLTMFGFDAKRCSVGDYSYRRQETIDNANAKRNASTNEIQPSTSQETFNS